MKKAGKFELTSIALTSVGLLTQSFIVASLLTGAAILLLAMQVSIARQPLKGIEKVGIFVYIVSLISILAHLNWGITFAGVVFAFLCMLANKIAFLKLSHEQI